MTQHAADTAPVEPASGGPALGDTLPDGSAPAAMSGATRRAMLLGAGAAAVAVLGACSTYDQNGSTGGGASGPPAGGQGGGSAGATSLARKADIPVGGGVVFKDQQVVVTQPQAGEFKAFTAVCTHQQCLVTEVKGGTINCPCHQSKFGIADGTPLPGVPAKKELKELTLAEDDVSIRLA